MNQSPSQVPATLSRQLGPIALLFTGFSIIGSGWLFAALYTAQIAGPAGIISWLIGGAVTLAIALVYAELGGMLPIAGALARIPYFSIGPLGGFLAGWLCWIAYVALAPVEAVAVLDYASNYLPWLTVNEGGERTLTGAGACVAIVLLAVFMAINLVGVRAYARANTAVTMWKVLVPLAASVILIAVGFRWENLNEFGGFAPYGLTGVFGAVSSGGIIFAFLGFRTVVDMAGEARNPQRDVPFAIIGTIAFCLVLYMLLQVAFIGAVSPSDLSQGWSGITESVAGGPFAAFATLLGLHWLATVLYADAIISPAGTGLAFTASTARLNYSLAKSRQIPEIFGRLNRFRVPGWSLAFNFVVGLIVVLPLPGWNEIVQFITTTAVLSFAFGPVALIVLRYQQPHRARPFQLPVVTVFSMATFVLVSFVVYWTGWETNWKIMLLALAGLALLLAMHLTGRTDGAPLQLRSSAWLWPYYAGLAAVSYLGNYGGGLGVIPSGIDLLVIAVFSLIIFRMAVRMRLDSDVVGELIESARAELSPEREAP